MKWLTPPTLLALFFSVSTQAQDLIETDATRTPASTAPAAPNAVMNQYTVEITGHKNAVQFEVIKEKIRGFLPEGSVSYEKSLRRGQVKLYIKTALTKDDLLAHLNGVTIEQKNSILSSQAEWVEGSSGDIQMKVGR